MKKLNSMLIACAAFMLTCSTSMLQAEWFIQFAAQDWERIPGDFSQELFEEQIQGKENEVVGLDLRGTALTSLPGSISNLIHLKWLDLRDTGLTSLPDSIGNLIHLKGLFLNDTNLTSLPDSISNLIHLKWLDLRDTNQLRMPPGIESKYYFCEQVDHLLARLRPLHHALQSADGYNNWNSELQRNFRIQLNGIIDQKLAQLKAEAQERGEEFDVTEENVVRLGTTEEIGEELPEDHPVHEYLMRYTPRGVGVRIKAIR